MFELIIQSVVYLGHTCRLSVQIVSECFGFFLSIQVCYKYLKFYSCAHFAEATPKSVMRVMGVKGLTLYHLKSHLQVRFLACHVLQSHISITFRHW